MVKPNLDRYPSETPRYPPIHRPRLHTTGLLRDVIVRIFLIAAIFALVNLATVRITLEGPSMLPTFETGQYLLVSRVNYMLSEPQRGDIAVFKAPDLGPFDYIKRVIGLPGDLVELRGPQTFVNGEQVQEPYVVYPCDGQTCTNRVWQLGPGEYFMMGDNRRQSTDSRVFGPIRREELLGEALLRYWPSQDFAWIHQIGYLE